MLSPLIKISVDLNPSPQIISNNRIDISQVEGWVLMAYFFSRSAVQKSRDESIQRYPCLPYPDNAVNISHQWNSFRCDRVHHDLFPSWHRAT